MSISIAYYISSHGYGHAARQQAVINELIRRGAGVHVRTAAPQKFFPHATTYHEQRYDIGLIQPDALSYDIPASFQWLADFLKQADSVIEQEAAFIRETGIRLVVADMPQIAFDIAEAAGVPSVLVSHFAWDWVYDHYMDDYPQYRYLVEAIRTSYRKATHVLRMPFAHDFSLFKQVEDIPLVFNPVTQSHDEIMAAHDIPPDCRIALLSMGGHDWSGNMAGVQQLDDWVFLVGAGCVGTGQRRPGAFSRDSAGLRRLPQPHRSCRCCHWQSRSQHRRRSCGTSHTDDLYPLPTLARIGIVGCRDAKLRDSCHSDR